MTYLVDFSAWKPPVDHEIHVLEYVEDMEDPRNPGHDVEGWGIGEAKPVAFLR